ncbi:MAG: GAF domain-containing protein [Acidobacteria bacterium]|nr:GAF domain-containing protein [Acidobacteriota bacterium]MBS1865639.1 GAF domain-containing protein [Acidobacteriota bacterium]
MSSAGLVSELERLAAAVSTQKPGEQEISLPALAERIAKALGVKPEEVAILAVSTKWRHLHFLVPQALRNVGFIPLSSPSALAARTARENRTELDNRFHETRHASVFEGVKAESLSAEAIQKIVSAPILSEGKVVGVFQVSRKGSSAALSGADFTSDDVNKINALCKPLGKLIQHLTGE